MLGPKTYSIEELETRTGFNARTIAYYIQEGLLPKVGRRGPSTRYPQLFVDRLDFIKRVRTLQDAGRLGSVTLPKIAAVILGLVNDEEPAADLLSLSEPEIERLFDEPVVAENRSPSRSAARRKEMMLARFVDEKHRPVRAHAVGPESTGTKAGRRGFDDELEAMDFHGASSRGSYGLPSSVTEAGADYPRLAALRRTVRELERKAQGYEGEPSAATQNLWTRARVLDHIEVAVRGVGAEDAALVEELAEGLRGILRGK